MYIRRRKAFLTVRSEKKKTKFRKLNASKEILVSSFVYFYHKLHHLASCSWLIVPKTFKCMLLVWLIGCAAQDVLSWSSPSVPALSAVPHHTRDRISLWDMWEPHLSPEQPDIRLIFLPTKLISLVFYGICLSSWKSRSTGCKQIITI